MSGRSRPDAPTGAKVRKERSGKAFGEDVGILKAGGVQLKTKVQCATNIAQDALQGKKMWLTGVMHV